MGPDFDKFIAFTEFIPKSFLTVITTNRTFGDSLQQKIPSFPRHTMLIADEVHNLGAKKLLSASPTQYHFV